MARKISGPSKEQERRDSGALETTVESERHLPLLPEHYFLRDVVASHGTLNALLSIERWVTPQLPDSLK